MRNKKVLLSAALVVSAVSSALAQGNGLAGINDATNMVTSGIPTEDRRRGCGRPIPAGAGSRRVRRPRFRMNRYQNNMKERDYG